MMDIYRVNVGEHFTHSLITHISSSVWIRASEKQFSCGKKDEVAEAGKRTKFLQLGFLGKFDQRWLWSTHGLNWLKFGGEFDFWRPYSLAQKSRSKGWPKLELRWLYCCCPALTFLGLTLSWLDNWFENCCDTFWVGRPRRLCWLKHPADHRNAPTHSLVSGLSSIDPLVCSISIFT